MLSYHETTINSRLRGISHSHSLSHIGKKQIQPNLNDSNTFGTKKTFEITYFDLMRVNHSAKPGGIMGVFFNFL